MNSMNLLVDNDDDFKSVELGTMVEATETVSTVVRKKDDPSIAKSSSTSENDSDDNTKDDSDKENLRECVTVVKKRKVEDNDDLIPKRRQVTPIAYVGKWTPEEEAYACLLIPEFKAGLLPLTDGTSLVPFLSKLLNCKQSRICYWFPSSNAKGKEYFRIGNQHFCRRTVDLNRLTPEQIQKTRAELSELEQKSRAELSKLERQFLERRVAQTRVYKTYAMSGTGAVKRIQTPHPHDVLSGCGYRGNKTFREWVWEQKEAYNLAGSKAEKAREKACMSRAEKSRVARMSKAEKALVANEVIELVKAQNSPGRFLQRDPGSVSGPSWCLEVDEAKALAKTHQALRDAQKGDQKKPPSSILDYTSTSPSTTQNQTAPPPFAFTPLPTVSTATPN